MNPRIYVVHMYVCMHLYMYERSYICMYVYKFVEMGKKQYDTYADFGYMHVRK